MEKDCILHQGATVDGYGAKKYQGKTVRAHRLAFCNANGIAIEAINGRVVMHSCDNPLCVNPDHLSLGSHADNCADKVSKGRQAKGQKSGNAKLTDLQVLNIMEEIKNGISGRTLAEKYQVSSMCISRIRSGKTWSHLWVA